MTKQLLVALLRYSSVLAILAMAGTASAQEAPRKLTPPGAERLAQAPDSKKKDAPAKNETAVEKNAPAAQQLAVPPPEVLLLMIRTNIIAVDQANKTNNYTVLRALAGPGMQALPPEKIAESFADMRTKQIDLAPTIVVSPQLTQGPGPERARLPVCRAARHPEPDTAGGIDDTRCRGRMAGRRARGLCGTRARCGGRCGWRVPIACRGGRRDARAQL